jgi:hypothetical protein
VHRVKPVIVPRNTFAEAVPLRPCAEAVIVAEPPPPVLRPVATPVLGLIVSTEGSLLVHTTPLVIWLVPVLFAYVPQACKVCGVPTSICGLGGWIVIAVRLFAGKNPVQLTPKASAIRTVKASVNPSLRPTNIRRMNINDRLRCF